MLLTLAYKYLIKSSRASVLEFATSFAQAAKRKEGRDLKGREKNHSGEKNLCAVAIKAVSANYYYNN